MFVRFENVRSLGYIFLLTYVVERSNITHHKIISRVLDHQLIMTDSTMPSLILSGKMIVLCLWMGCLPIVVPIPHHSINPSFSKHLLLQAYAKFGAATVEIKADEFSRLGLLTNSGRNYLCMYIANRVCRTTVILLFVS